MDRQTGTTGARMKLNGVGRIWDEENGYYKTDGFVGASTVHPDLIANHMQWMENRYKYLEIGSYDGIAVSILAKKYPDKEFHCVDAFIRGFETEAGHSEYFLENTSEFPNVVLYVGKSEDVLPTLKREFDFIFIDGDHSYEGVRGDFQLALGLCVPGGRIVFHDYEKPCVKQAIDEVCVEKNLTLKGTFIDI